MAHERIKEIAAKVYEELEVKTVIDLVLPARKLVLDNVLNAAGERGSTSEVFNCSSLQDINADDGIKKVFKLFYKNEQWSVKQVKEPDGSYVIYLEAKHDDCSLQIRLDNYGLSTKATYIINAFTFKNNNAETLLVNEGGDEPLSLEIGSYGHDEEIILHNGKGLAEQLINEAKVMIEQLSNQFEIDNKN